MIQISPDTTAGKAASKLAYSVGSAAEAVDYGRSSLYEEIKAGRLKVFKIGARTLIHHDDLTTWLNSHRNHVV